jgi:hypothetical protein
MKGSLLRKADHFRWQGKRTWNYLRTVSELDPPRIVYGNKDGLSLLVFLNGGKPHGFDLALGDGKVLLYDGRGHYNYGYWNERKVMSGHFAEFVPVERKDFDKDFRLNEFQLESEKIEPEVRQYIADAIRNFDNEPQTEPESDEETERLMERLDQALAKKPGFFGWIATLFRRHPLSPSSTRKN